MVVVLQGPASLLPYLAVRTRAFLSARLAAVRLSLPPSWSFELREGPLDAWAVVDGRRFKLHPHVWP